MTNKAVFKDLESSGRERNINNHDNFDFGKGSGRVQGSFASLAQSCPTLCDPMDCSPPGSTGHGILQGRTLEWVAILFSRGSSHLRDGTRVSCIAGRFFTIWASRDFEFLEKSKIKPLTCWLPQSPGPARLQAPSTSLQASWAPRSGKPRGRKQN